jgi:hypothetical protein
MRKLLIALLMIPALARAEFWSGNDLHQRLTSTDVMERMYGLGYVIGIYDAYVHVAFCPKTESGITAGQINDIVKQYLNANPSRRHMQGYTLVRESLQAVWPCANRNNNNRGSV